MFNNQPGSPPRGCKSPRILVDSLRLSREDVLGERHAPNFADTHYHRRKQQVTQQTTELEALEARIKEMEKRLKTQSPTPSAAQQQRQAAAPVPGSSGSPRGQRAPLSNAFSDAPP